MVQINSFYGNTHKAPTPQRERLYDLFRRAAIESAILLHQNAKQVFYTPEVRAGDFTDPKNPIDGALQLLIGEDGPTRWAVKLQHKRYTTLSKGIILVSERVLGHDLSSLEAFDMTLSTYAALKHNDKARKELTGGSDYYYDMRESYTRPVITTNSKEAIFMPVTRLPLYAAEIFGDKRLLLRRDQVLTSVRQGFNTLQNV